MAYHLNRKDGVITKVPFDNNIDDDLDVFFSHHHTDSWNLYILDGFYIREFKNRLRADIYSYSKEKLEQLYVLMNMTDISDAKDIIELVKLLSAI